MALPYQHAAQTETKPGLPLDQLTGVGTGLADLLDESDL